MPRPFKNRRIGFTPNAFFFKPRGIPMRELDTVTLEMDELEALRLADFEGLYQEQAAERMGVSRQTFGNIVATARHKVAEALCLGKAIAVNNPDIGENFVPGFGNGPGNSQGRGFRGGRNNPS